MDPLAYATDEPNTVAGAASQGERPVSGVLGLALRASLSVFPWFMRRRLLTWLFGYRFHPGARISALALVAPRRLVMGRNASIGAFTVIINLDDVVMGECAAINRSNWITGYPAGSSIRFTTESSRQARLVLEDHACITKHHHIDCTNSVRIGTFTTIAGYRSQILTHSINLRTSRQESRPVAIGAYCLVGTSCVILPGSALPDRCILGAMSLLAKPFTEELTLYGGVPAIAVKKLPDDYRYFSREQGFVL